MLPMSLQECKAACCVQYGFTETSALLVCAMQAKSTARQAASSLLKKFLGRTELISPGTVCVTLLVLDEGLKGLCAMRLWPVLFVMRQTLTFIAEPQLEWNAFLSPARLIPVGRYPCMQTSLPKFRDPARYRYPDIGKQRMRFM